MGKRNKSQKNEDTPIKKKKTVISNVEEIEEVNLNEASVPAISNQTKKKKRKHKNKNQEQNVEMLNEDAKLDELVPQLEKIEKKRKLKKQMTNSLDSTNGKSRKIVFVDDVPHEVSSNKETTKSAEKKNKFLNDDEAEVKDEDIDKFCDELDEEDNKQYEDWVKLIEAKLHENKKSK